jgi:hypothetical protein
LCECAVFTDSSKKAKRTEQKLAVAIHSRLEDRRIARDATYVNNNKSNLFYETATRPKENCAHSPDDAVGVCELTRATVDCECAAKYGLQNANANMRAKQIGAHEHNETFFKSIITIFLKKFQHTRTRT